MTMYNLLKKIPLYTIFGTEPHIIKASLYPLQDGAGISLTYLIN